MNFLDQVVTLRSVIVFFASYILVRMIIKLIKRDFK